MERVGMAVTALAATLTVTGCGGSKPESGLRAATSSSSSAGAPALGPFGGVAVLHPPSAAGVQGFIAAVLRAHLPDAATVGVQCPPPPPPGQTGGCTATVGGVAVPYTVVARDASSLAVRPTQPIVRTGAMVDAVRAKFAGDYVNPTVDCGPGVIVVAKQDEEFTCRITDGTRESTAHVVVVDDNGGIAVTP